jgi:hypothetical protein
MTEEERDELVDKYGNAFEVINVQNDYTKEFKARTGETLIAKVDHE